MTAVKQVALAVLAMLWLAVAPATARPNVLFIALDDMNDWTTVFDKDNPIQTPNIERLAARGMFFENAYCAAPACCPSRAAIMTGRAPHKSGVYKNGDAWAKLLPDVEVIPRYFMAHGYETRGCGKLHHHGGTGRDPKGKPSFQKQGSWHLHAGKPERNYNGYTSRPLSSPAFDWGEHNVAKHNDEYTVEWGVDVMQQEWKAGMEPQFLALGIFRPHLPFWAPSRSFKPYPLNDQLVMPKAPKGDLEDISPVGYRMTLKEKFFQENVRDQPDFSPGSDEQLVRCYQAASTFADEMVGRILDALDASGQADNTIIVLWSDHGYHLGDKECYVKFTLWEKANRVPFIIVAPGVTTPGSRCKAPVSLLDIYPTLVDLAGLPPNPTNDGLSLRPLLAYPDMRWDRPALMTYGKGNHAIRTREYRYIRYEDGSEELYADKDGWNITNLVGKAETESVLNQHRELLATAVGPDAVGETVQAPPSPRVKAAINEVPELSVGELLFSNSDFETGTLENWTAEGDAFTVQPTKGDNPTARGRRDGAAHQGEYWIGTFEKHDGKTGKPGDRRGDGPTGMLTSTPFTVEKRYITFRVGGGPDASKVSVRLLCDGKTNVMSAGFAGETMKLVSFDASEFVGRKAQIAIADQAKGGWGHINADDFRGSDTSVGKPAMALGAPSSVPESELAPGEEDPSFRTFESYKQVGYDQKLRPQFHFTSRVGWLNDPNGMVYYDGEWHMLFQHFAKGNASGAKSWGNAVSTDLMHWQQLPHAINPYAKVDGSDGIHAIWSGSAVVDVLNALGKQEGDTKTLFALYSATHEKFFQGGACSTDRGRTWTRVNDGRPVIPHQEGYSKGQRDPRIFYYALGQFYVTIMMVGGPERAVRLWKSTDLLDWEHISDIPNKAAECIDMYTIPLDGDTTRMKWVIADAGTRYEVGEFDGKTWKGSGQGGHFDYGDSYYAAQVFNQAPDHRVVHIGWLRSKGAGHRPFLDADMPFTQQMSIPAEITLRTTPDGVRMFRNPVKEIETLYRKSDRFTDLTVKEVNAKLVMLRPALIDMTIEFAPAGDLTLDVRGLPVKYEHEKQEFQFTNTARVEGQKAGMAKLPKARQRPYRDTGLRAIPAPAVEGVVTLRALVDRASLELFVNEGQAAASFVVVPDAATRTIKIIGAESQPIRMIEINELKSMWESQR